MKIFAVFVLERKLETRIAFECILKLLLLCVRAKVTKDDVIIEYDVTMDCLKAARKYKSR